MHRLLIDNTKRTPSRHRRGFTLVEILIVVVILGILAAIVVPQFSNASHMARENTLKDDLRFVRQQLGIYKAQHNDFKAGYPAGDPSGTPTEALLLAQMTLASDMAGNTNATPSATYKYGPYLSRLPANPLTADGVDGDAIKVATSAADLTPDESTGWIYYPATQQFIANLSGSDGNGTPYADY